MGTVERLCKQFTSSPSPLLLYHIGSKQRHMQHIAPLSYSLNHRVRGRKLVPIVGAVQ